MRRPSIPSVICAISCLIAIGCQSTPREATIAVRSSSTPSASVPAAPRRNLSEDEDAGGHTLRKHVGRTDDQLRERLDHERNIAAASTYTDRDAAEIAVGTALQQNRDKLQRWLDRQGRRPNLVLDYDGDPSRPIGRTLRRGEDKTEPCSHAVVVLRSTAESGFYVLTSYPECR